MRYLALLKDSWVEALDRKSMWFLVIVSLLVISLCASIRFSELSPEQALDHTFGGMNVIRRFSMEGESREAFSVRFSKDSSKKLGADAGDFADGIEVELSVGPVQEFHRLIHTWNAGRRGKLRKFGERPPEAQANPVPDPGDAMVQEFFRVQLAEAGIRRVECAPMGAGDDALKYRLRVRADSLQKLAGTRELSFFFGLAKTTMQMSPAQFIAVIEAVVADTLGGFFGLLIAVVFTAGIIPNLLQKGTVDVVLTRPVTRWGVLLTKYVGSLAYVLIPATILIGGCWVALSARVGYFHPGFLMCIPILVLLFGILQAFSVLVGVLFRSTIVSILTTIGLWFVGSMVTGGRVLLKTADLGVPDSVHTTLRVLTVILPKTTEIGALMKNFVIKSHLEGPMAAAMTQEASASALAGPLEVTLCSIGFVAVNLGLACWIFSRRDQ